MSQDPQAQVKEVRGNMDPPSPYPTRGDATISPPEALKDGKADLTKKSVKDVGQAWDICKATEVSNISRAARTSDIQAIFDGAPPRSAGDKLQKGASWQHNFSTRWMAGIVKPVVMRFVNAVTSQIYLTRSALPPSYPNWKAKSDLFQSKTTRLFRLWKGFTPFLNRLAVENVLQGYTYAVFLDQYTWKPKAMKQDRAFVPEESEQFEKDLQYFVVKYDFILADFIALFSDEEAAQDNGYDLKNCNWAAESAQVKDPRDDATTTQFRKFQEMLTDGSLGLTYSFSSPRIVKTWLFWNQEYDDSVSFWIIERDSGRLLRYSHKLYKTMEPVLKIFTLDPGNGSIHSSLGLGRYLAAQAIVIERHRNRMLDNAMMSGLLLLKVDPKDRARVNTEVASPFVYIDKTIDEGEQQFQANSEGYIAADNLITSWAEQIAGVYVQAQIQANGGSDKTATEASIDAARERELGDVVMRRWLDQISGLVQAMQGRAYREELLDEGEDIFKKLGEDADVDAQDLFDKSSDSDAVEIIVELLQEGVSPKEIKKMRDNPASGFSHVDVAVIQQGVNRVAIQYRGDPDFDQTMLKRMDVEAQVGPDLTRQLMPEKQDENMTIQATRQQLGELATMSTLMKDVPVAPGDNHAIHGITLIPILKGFQALLEQPVDHDPVLLKKVELVLNHLGAHVQAMMQYGQKDSPAFRLLDEFYLGFKKDFLQIVQIQQHMKAAASLVAQKLSAERAAGAAAAPVAPGGAVSAPPPGAPMGAAPAPEPETAEPEQLPAVPPPQ